MLVGTSTTAISLTAILSHQLDSTTNIKYTGSNLTSTTVTSGAQTIDFRFGQSGTTATGDTATVQKLTIERIY